jgi:hypothetical protein
VEARAAALGLLERSFKSVLLASDAFLLSFLVRDYFLSVPTAVVDFLDKFATITTHTNLLGRKTIMMAHELTQGDDERCVAESTPHTQTLPHIINRPRFRC